MWVCWNAIFLWVELVIIKTLWDIAEPGQKPYTIIGITAVVATASLSLVILDVFITEFPGFFGGETVILLLLLILLSIGFRKLHHKLTITRDNVASQSNFDFKSFLKKFLYGEILFGTLLGWGIGVNIYLFFEDYDSKNDLAAVWISLMMLTLGVLLYIIWLPALTEEQKFARRSSVEKANHSRKSFKSGSLPKKDEIHPEENKPRVSKSQNSNSKESDNSLVIIRNVTFPGDPRVTVGGGGDSRSESSPVLEEIISEESAKECTIHHTRKAPSGSVVMITVGSAISQGL